MLIAYLRADPPIRALLADLLVGGHTIGTSCVNVAEVERGLRDGQRRSADLLVGRLRFLPTTREAAQRAGRYQADFARLGRTVHTPDALVAGTARAHGAVVLTDNLRDFPMTDIRVEAPPQ